MTARPLVCLLFTGVIDSSYRLQINEERANGRQGKALEYRKWEYTHGCIPQNFASFPSSKGDGMFQCCTYRLVRLLPRFLISSSNPRAVCERNPKNARHSAMRTELCLLLRDWARTSIKLVKPRVRSLIQRPAPSWRRRNERKHAVNCRHFIWLHWPITGLVPGTTLPWTSASSRLARSCPVSKYYRKSVLRSKSWHGRFELQRFFCRKLPGLTKI